MSVTEIAYIIAALAFGIVFVVAGIAGTLTVCDHFAVKRRIRWAEFQRQQEYLYPESKDEND